MCRNCEVIIKAHGDLLDRDACFSCDGCCCHRVADLVCTHDLQINLHRTCLTTVQLETSASEIIQDNVAGKIIRCSITAGTKGHYLATGARRHRCYSRIIGVEHSDAAISSRWYGFDKFAFRLCDGVLGTEFAQVGTSDVEHQPDTRRGNFCQLRDVPKPARRKLCDEEFCIRTTTQCCIRMPNFVIERSRWGDRGPGRRQERCQHVFGGSLSGRTGDTNHAEGFRADEFGDNRASKFRQRCQ